MVRRDLQARAALLYRLGYPARLTKARLLANLRWDFELHGNSKHEQDIGRIVDVIYRRGGEGSGPPSV
jgi:hypothetical protein